MMISSPRNLDIGDGITMKVLDRLGEIVSNDPSPTITTKEISNTDGGASLNPHKPTDKRTWGRTSFTCSARDFVPHRTDRFEDYYDLCELLGEGAFGAVYRCRNKRTGSERAVKIIEKGRMCPHEQEDVINEFQLLRRIDNPNVIRMYEFFDTQGKFYFVQELATGGELYNELNERGALPEEEVARLMKQVLSCLKYLAQLNIVHRDLNLENILLDESKDWLKLIDFGLATTFQNDEKLTDIVGKMHYLAPEVLEQRYGPKYDVWSAGVIAYILLAGFAPFEAQVDADIRHLIMEGHVSFDDPEWAQVSDDAKDFVRKLLTYEEDLRPTAEEALCHPWIADEIRKSSDTFRKRHSVVAADALDNLRAFSVPSRLKQATCCFIASQLLETEHRQAIGRIFRGMDDDCDGKLSMDNLRAKYREFSTVEISNEEIQELFEQCDLTGSGYIDYSEFVIASMRSCDLLDDKKLRVAFENFDSDKTGFISAKSLKESLAHGGSWEDDVVDKIIQQVRGGKDDLISFPDFLSIMKEDSNGTERTEDDNTHFGSLDSLCDEEKAEPDSARAA
jgi:calcium-dependent protein kinase